MIDPAPDPSDRIKVLSSGQRTPPGPQADGPKHHEPLVTALLGLFLLGNLLILIGVVDFFTSPPTTAEGLAREPFWPYWVLSFFVVCNFVGSIALWRWKKWGFFAIGFSGLVMLVAELFDHPLPIFSLMNLGFVALLYILLRMGGAKSAWSQLA